MKIYKLLVIIVLGCFLFSCSSKRQILYMQDLDISNEYSINYVNYRVNTDDILKIEIFAENPESALFLNPNGISNTNVTKESLLFNGYQVNSEGYINFPSIGNIYVMNLTIEEIRKIIYDEIVNNGILKSPTVDIKLLNAHFTILGEVAKPGRYEYLKNNMNILNAIGMAGDLTINGMRKDIKLIRDNNGEKSISSIDLTSKNLLSNKNFQIISGDIIIVNPNSTRVKNAGIIGNSGTLLSLLSFILSSIIVISNN